MKEVTGMDPGIKEVVLSIGGREGGLFSIVLFDDGNYGITRDGAKIAHCEDDLKDCLKRLQTLAGIAPPTT